MKLVSPGAARVSETTPGNGALRNRDSSNGSMGDPRNPMFLCHFLLVGIWHGIRRFHQQKLQDSGSRICTYHIHPRKLTCPLKRDYFNRKYIFQPSFFRKYVSFQGGNCHNILPFWESNLQLTRQAPASSKSSPPSLEKTQKSSEDFSMKNPGCLIEILITYNGLWGFMKESPNISGQI